ncbi:hypothetical protein MTBPR1_50187 [Candidatus Terasakiella magnetica]|uniref:Uncharacterized protein n=1 Tax=Candidatus Terasakiella magnetica TaxID=1867952 RepID=A0A1C3RJK2_9PROT|nr:hypothetical protein [Candidatus Terasakiella magnetica]SCA57431.1 hypothetical protein MTBPR1_50187 [Candidatus Terasakiella magnetica]
MDPQMVWDMMDECDAQVDSHAAPSASAEPEVESEVVEEKPAKKAATGWMGFPVYGMK